VKCEGDFKLAMQISRPGISVQLLPIKESPIQFLKLGLDWRRDLLKKAEIYNVGANEVRAIRMGWIIVPRDGGPTVTGESSKLSFAEALMPKADVQLENQNVVPPRVDGDLAVAVFVSEVEFSNGSEWHANIERIKEEIVPASTLRVKPKKDTKELSLNQLELPVNLRF